MMEPLGYNYLFLRLCYVNQIVRSLPPKTIKSHHTQIMMQINVSTNIDLFVMTMIINNLQENLKISRDENKDKIDLQHKIGPKIISRVLFEI